MSAAIVVAFAVSPAAFAASDQKTYLVDDFETPAALEHWRFETGPEPSAASGGVTLGPGHREHGALLTYRLPWNRGALSLAYAQALFAPASPLPKMREPAISLWIRHSADVQVALVARDSKGHTLRFPILASIERPAAGDWQYAVIPMSGKHAQNADAGGEIEGRLVEIGIRVQERTGAASDGATMLAGSVAFDEIRLRESTETWHVDTAAPTEPALESSGLASRLGVTIHLLRDDRSLDLAHAAGFGFVRMDLLWANVERAGRYRFGGYDRLLRALDDRGMGALWTLDYGHPDHGGSTPRTPDDVAAFARFAEAAAAHFRGRNVRYEIWNEPDIAHFWTPYPNSSEYAALLRAAAAAIRRGDPLAKVSSGGMSRFDIDFLSRAVDASLASELTAIGVHPYPRPGPETIAPELELLRAWTARTLGERIEVWDTEWGYSSANAPSDDPANGHTEEGRRRQAALAIREILTVWASGFPLACWYDLKDDGPDAENPEHNYGLLDASGNEKPAMQAVRTLLGVAKGRKYAGMLGEMPAGMHAMRFDGAQDTILIVWTDQPDGRRAIEFPKRGLISATDCLGGVIQLKNKSSGQVRAEIDALAGPVYLDWASGAHEDLVHLASRHDFYNISGNFSRRSLVLLGMSKHVVPKNFLIVVPIVTLGVALVSVAQQAATEAPAAFATPTLATNPGSQSFSNGFPEPPNDTFAADQAVFEANHDPSTGLGPIFNAASCVTCHQNPVTGSASQITEIRVGHRDDNGNFVNPTVSVNAGQNAVGGRSVINDRAICVQAQENVPEAENIRTLRAVLNTLGDGFVEAIDDSAMIAIAQGQPALSGGLIQGEVIQVPVLESPGQTRVARFGWKNQHASLLSFSADAFLNEMGVTSRLKPADSTSVCKITADPEDHPDSNGLAEIDHFAAFIRGTQAPPRDTVAAATADAKAGQALFESVGCNICHAESMTTAAQGTFINGGAYAVPEALASKTIHPFGDFLLHDIGTGDGIVQVGPQDTADKMRTAPLWGLRTKSRYMHDLASLTLSAAIDRHRGEAREVRQQFNALTATQKQQVIVFLKSL